MRNVSVIGIDIAKRSAEICLMSANGRLKSRKTVRRGQILETVLQLGEVACVAMEACGGSHYWARELEINGYKVKLIPPQYVKPFRKYHKNDRNDAEAIATAATRRNMPSVAPKTIQQQGLQHLHCIRERLVRERTAVVNQLHGMFLEYGIALRRTSQMIEQVLLALEKYSARLGSLGRENVVFLCERLKQLSIELDRVNDRIKQIAASSPAAKRLQTAVGVGPVISTAIVAKYGSESRFENGRHFAASLGLVPAQHSTGATQRLGGITKRGDRYLRKLLVQGALSFLRAARRKTDAHSLWAVALEKRRGLKCAVLGIANKMARILWRLLADEEQAYNPLRACVAR